MIINVTRHVARNESQRFLAPSCSSSVACQGSQFTRIDRWPPVHECHQLTLHKVTRTASFSLIPVGIKIANGASRLFLTTPFHVRITPRRRKGNTSYNKLARHSTNNASGRLAEVWGKVARDRTPFRATWCNRVPRSASFWSIGGI